MSAHAGRCFGGPWAGQDLASMRDRFPLFEAWVGNAAQPPVEKGAYLWRGPVEQWEWREAGSVLGKSNVQIRIEASE